MTHIKTSQDKKNPQSSDWVQVQDAQNTTCNINLNLVEEVKFYPDIAGEPSVTIFYASGRQEDISGEQAYLLWKLVNHGISFKFERLRKLEPETAK